MGLKDSVDELSEMIMEKYGICPKCNEKKLGHIFNNNVHGDECENCGYYKER